MSILRILLLLLWCASTTSSVEREDVLKVCDAENLVRINSKWNKVAEHILKEEWSKAEKKLKSIPVFVHSTCVRVEFAVRRSGDFGELKSLIGIDSDESTFE